MTYNKQVLHAIRQIISKAHLVLLLKSMLHIQFIIYLVLLGSQDKSSNGYFMCLSLQNVFFITFGMLLQLHASSFAIYAAWWVW